MNLYTEINTAAAHAAETRLRVELRATRSFDKVALGVVPRRVVDERLAEQHLDLVVCPALRWQRLQEHDDPLWKRAASAMSVQKRLAGGGGAYLKVHFLQLSAPLDEERRAYVEMELRECIGSLCLQIQRMPQLEACWLDGQDVRTR